MIATHDLNNTEIKSRHKFITDFRENVQEDRNKDMETVRQIYKRIREQFTQDEATLMNKIEQSYETKLSELDAVISSCEYHVDISSRLLRVGWVKFEETMF